MEISSFIVTPTLVENDFEKEFITELVESFYKSLRWCLSLILKNLKTPFKSLKPILSQYIESKKDVRGATEAAFLEQMVSYLERDVDEWCHLNREDLTPLIEE